ncbi:ATP-binding protein [Streptomyces genisteinicus]|uniref:ATP-binding protein n=1 Tax=Streptomyces genisteinicus TaxID=2768068 RepID=A0A7H0HMG5_9ACTN|nr:ATP-binding protein [Streptomyces genisteinicus]QNP61731.1 ATP-binding protein [Streptomyces genisteinicus]
MTTDETASVRSELLAEERDVTAASARDEVRRLLDEEFCRQPTGPDDDVVVADALLVTSELVTNAIRHGGGVSSFTASVSDEGLWITVADRSHAWPTAQPTASGDMSPGGFGLRVVRRLSKDVTIVSVPGGKAVHVLVPLR